MQNQYIQTIRNTGRIEQLEAGQADLRELVYTILNQQWLSRPAIVKSARFEEQQKDIEQWKQVRAVLEAEAVTIGRLTLPYEKKLSAINSLYVELEENFAEIPRRIALCALMEQNLAALEDLLEDEETECLAWCVSLIRDILDYNYVETFEATHLGLIKKTIDLICKNGTDCNKEDYQNLHKEFLETGLTLVPITQKAIDNYGE